MIVTDFPACCGALLATGFTGTDTEIKRWSESLHTTYKRRKGMVVGIINGNQLKWHKKVLRDSGWIITRGATNPLHGSRIYTIYLKLNQ